MIGPLERLYWGTFNLLEWWAHTNEGQVLIPLFATVGGLWLLVDWLSTQFPDPFNVGKTKTKKGQP